MNIVEASQDQGELIFNYFVDITSGDGQIQHLHYKHQTFILFVILLIDYRSSKVALLKFIFVFPAYCKNHASYFLHFLEMLGWDTPTDRGTHTLAMILILSIRARGAVVTVTVISLILCQIFSFL